MEFTTVLTTLITAVSSVFVALITAGYFRRLHDRNVENKSKKLLMVQIQKDELIHFTLREIRRKYNSDRVYILQFHNGGTFYTKSPMQRASVT
jgi:Na+-translocating ferredoxin:NAD+ oxidoreductase RnfG subunit